jgi:glutathione S-transferase
VRGARWKPTWTSCTNAANPPRVDATTITDHVPIATDTARRILDGRRAVARAGAPTPERLKAAAHRNLAQLRPQIRIVEQLLARGGPFLLAERPGQADLAVYHALWFLGCLKIDCSGELAGYPLTRAWMARAAGSKAGSRSSPARASSSTAAGSRSRRAQIARA